jgi:hypothetical protein
MREYPGPAADAIVRLHERLEQLTSQLSELECLRARVLEAERRVLITVETAPSRSRAPSRHTRFPVSPVRSSL